MLPKLSLLDLSQRAISSNGSSALFELQTQLYHELRTAERPVQKLTTWFLDRRNLEAAWERVRRTDGANTPGTDGVACRDLEDRVGPWLAQLADDIYHRRYHPLPPRWLEVPKPNRPGAKRKLGILAIKDRVVQAGLKQILETLLEPVFLNCSFGFRPGRSVPAALHSVTGLLRCPQDQSMPYTHGVQLDIANCFDTIDHDVLRSELARHIADPEVMRLIDLILHSGGITNGKFWWKRKTGIVQGSSLSPLLCNLYLHPLDQAIHDAGQLSQNGIRVFRYADDILLLARGSKLAERGLSLVRQVLRRLHLKLKDNGACIVPVESGLSWLGVRLQPRPHRWTGETTFGYLIPDAKVVEMLDRITEMTAPPSQRIDGSAFNPARWIVSINQQLRDWRQAYRFADNAPEVFRVLDDHTRECVATLLVAITQTKRSQIYQQYRVKLPRGFWTWEVPGARLVVLSSLAPYAPANLIRKPRWMWRRPEAKKALEEVALEEELEVSEEDAPTDVPEKEIG
ncbi:MAG: reverse transcriptase domain-containing protein [Gemmataceae bacterium]